LLFVLVLASRRDGAVAAYTYAYMFFQLPHGLFAVSLMTTITPELAVAANAGDLATMRRHFETGLRYLIVVVLPASVACFVLAQPAVIGVLAHGAFGRHDAHVTADTLQMFAVGLVPFSVYLYVLRGFYALQDTRTPFYVNCVENALNIVLAVLLFPRLGVQGLALAFAGAYVLTAALALVLLVRRIGGGADARTVRLAVRAGVAAVVLGVVAAPVAGAIGSTDTAHALAATLAGAAAGAGAFFLASRAMRIGEIGAIFGRWRTAPTS
jgi:putative peptidoglycan lipid II flippase